MDVMDYACAAIDGMMRRYEASELPPSGRFYYHQGVFLSGVYRIACLLEDHVYQRYIRQWIDSVLKENGQPKEPPRCELDDIQAGVLLFPLLDTTGEPRYRLALESLRELLLRLPRVSEGAPVHKAKLPGQLWLDGLYMSGPFCFQYAKRFQAAELREYALNHIQVMLRHTVNPDTGLLHHAWDETRQEPWASPVSGRSPECWGRAMGWVLNALLDDMDFLSPTQAAYETIAETEAQLLATVCRHQSADGRWYQVVDRGDRADNWLENSCSCLFTAALYKAMRKSILPASFQECAGQGYEGVIRSLDWQDGTLQIGHVCVGTNVGDYQHYIHRPVGVNDLHGVGAFLIMCAEKAMWDQKKVAHQEDIRP